MKKKIFFSLISFFALSGCGNNLTKQQLFEMNNECNKQREEIKSNYPLGSIGEIFYSPKTNSCLYIMVHKTGKVLVDNNNMRANGGNGLVSMENETICKTLYGNGIDKETKKYYSKCLNDIINFDKKVNNYR